MRNLIDIMEQVDLPWGFGNAGCWILPDGGILPCDYENDVHHGDIVAQMGLVDDLDPDELDEFVEIGCRKGWVRIRMRRETFCVECYPELVDRQAIAMIPRVEDGNHDAYVLDYGVGKSATFPTMGKLMLSIRSLASEQTT